MFIDTADNREEALRAIKRIAVQGEGSPGSTDPADGSHFGRFLRIYRVFPEPASWKPTRNIPTNPRIAPSPGPNVPLPDVNDITNERSQRWARLFDLRYHMLLAAVSHFMHLDEPLYVVVGDKAGDRTERGFLQLWAFEEMRRTRKIVDKLMAMPRGDEPRDRAGATFTLPDAQTPPEDETSRWRAQLALLGCSLSLVEEMREANQTDRDDPFLQSLLQADGGRVAIAEAKVSGVALPQHENFRKVMRILDEAVRGFMLGEHGNFWLGRRRDEFRDEPVEVFGLRFKLIHENQDGTFSGAESNLVKVLRGEAATDIVGNPFPVGRIPARRPPVHDSRISYIESWIDAGCPDSEPAGEIGLMGEPVPSPEPASPEPPATPTWPRIKEILDQSITRWREASGREPQLVARHGDGFGWDTKEELAAASARNRRLIEPEKVGNGRGRETNLVVALKTGAAPFRRMPAGCPFNPDAEVEEIVLWIDAGTGCLPCGRYGTAFGHGRAALAEDARAVRVLGRRAVRRSGGACGGRQVGVLLGRTSAGRNAQRSGLRRPFAVPRGPQQCRIALPDAARRLGPPAWVPRRRVGERRDVVRRHSLPCGGPCGRASHATVRTLLRRGRRLAAPPLLARAARVDDHAIAVSPQTGYGLPAGDQHLVKSPAASFVDTPCIAGDVVANVRAVAHPGLERPVAFVRDIAVSSLLEAIAQGGTVPEIVRRWLPGVAPRLSMEIIGWLCGVGILVPAPSPLSISAGGVAHVPLNACER